MTSPSKRDYRWYRVALMVDGRVRWSEPIMATSTETAMIMAFSLCLLTAVLPSYDSAPHRNDDVGTDPRQTSFPTSDRNGGT